MRRLAAAGAVVCLLLVGLAAASGRGPGWLLIVAAAVAAIVLVPTVAVLLLQAPVTRVRAPRERPELQVPWSMLAIAAVLGLLAWALSSIHIGRPKPITLLNPSTPTPRAAAPRTHGSSGGGIPAGPWIALALGLLVLAVLIGVGVQSWRTRRTTMAVETVPAGPDPLALAVEAALFDLENEADPRRAVIKAYASTESVLREHGLPRRPAEAPLEYLDRVLRDLGAGAAAVDRLTRLFEHAAFSPHDVDPGMRAEAVAAFHGLRARFARQGTP